MTEHEAAETLDLTKIRVSMTQAAIFILTIVGFAGAAAVTTYQSADTRREMVETRAELAELRRELRGVATREDLEKLAERVRELEKHQ